MINNQEQNKQGNYRFKKYKFVKGFNGDMELVKVVEDGYGDDFEVEVTLVDYVSDNIKTGNRLIDEYELDVWQTESDEWVYEEE